MLSEYPAVPNQLVLHRWHAPDSNKHNILEISRYTDAMIHDMFSNVTQYNIEGPHNIYQKQHRNVTVWRYTARVMLLAQMPISKPTMR